MTELPYCLFLSVVLYVFTRRIVCVYSSYCMNLFILMFETNNFVRACAYIYYI